MAIQRQKSEQSLTDKAYAFIKAAILSGRIGAGASVEVNEIAETIGVSKTPVREAVLRLANEGVLEVTSRKGIRVVPISAARLSEIYQVITAIEVEAVSRMAELKLGKDELKPAFEQALRMRMAVELGDENDWNLADEGYHRALLELSENSQLFEAGSYYRDLAQRAHFVALRMVPLEQKAKSVEAHFDLLKLIMVADPAVCRQRHREQRERGAALLVNSLEKLGVDHF